MHYRLADHGDSVVAVVLQAVTHALGHIEAVRRDARALAKTTGCDVPPPACPPSFDCCSPGQPTSGRGPAFVEIAR